MRTLQDLLCEKGFYRPRTGEIVNRNTSTYLGGSSPSTLRFTPSKVPATKSSIEIIRERQCYLLDVAHKMSMSDITNELGVSKRMIQQTISRAKKKLKDRVGKNPVIYG